MTDQNHSNRDDRDLLADNDPLAELARIISGGPEGRRSKEADHVADEARSDMRDSAKEANHDMAVSSGDEDDFDIEAVLARELREPPSGKQPEAETQEATDTGATAGAATTEPEEPVGDGNEPEETEELSIEEQLMAELAGEDGQDTLQEARLSLFVSAWMRCRPSELNP